jgi:hypothetical protein
MGKVRTHDDVIWAKNIEGDSRLRDRIRRLKAGELVDLEVNGVVGRWERMRDGRDGRPSLGIKPLAEMRLIWAKWRQEPARIVDIHEVAAADTYRAAVSLTLSEWDSPEDELAYRDL